MVTHVNDNRQTSGVLNYYPSSARDVSSAEAIRNLNRAQVLDAIRTINPISYSDLVEKVQLSRTTISSIVNEMLEIGLLVKVGQAASTGGRRPMLLGYNPTGKMAVGVTMFDNELLAVTTDMEGCPLKFLRHPWSGQRFDDLVEQMIEMVQELCTQEECQRVVGVGAGMPGVVDVDRGTIVEYVTAGRHMETPIEVRRIMEEALCLPVIVANRSRTAALGELRAGVGRDVRNLIYLSIGRGVVAGIVIGGEIYFGTNFSSGEIGHNTVVPDGPLCGCGNRGCLEMYTSAGSMVARAIAKARSTPTSLLRQAINDGNLQLMTLDIVLDCARQGDPAAREVLDETGVYIGIALSDAVNLLNPEMIVLGGPIGWKAGPLLIEPALREIERHALPMSISCVRLVVGSEGSESAATGAAVLALKNTTIEKIFASPGRLVITPCL